VNPLQFDRKGVTEPFENKEVDERIVLESDWSGTEIRGLKRSPMESEKCEESSC
jgi:hypothetical protein